MTEDEKLKRTIAHFDTQRNILGEDTVRAATVVLRQRLADLNTAQRNSPRPEHPGMASRFVGRKAEFGAIKRRIEHLVEGQGRFVSLIGEAGMGKSRLVVELRNSVCGHDANLPVQWLEGSALSMGRVVSYWVFREIIQQYADITEQDNEDVAWHKLKSRLEALLGERSAEILPYLATMIAMHVKEEYIEQVRYLNGEAMRSQIFFAARRLFERMAETQPVVLVLEDLQWIEEASAGLLQHLVPLIYRVPIFILCVSRPTIDTPHSRLCEVMATVYHDRYDEIVLPPLSRPESAQLAAHVLRQEGQGHLVIDKVVEKTGGNPFFIEETVRSLIYEGLVRRDSSSDEWELDTEIETMKVPHAIQSLILARVEMLNELLKRTVRIAAVIGRSFLYRVLVAAAHPASEIHEQLEALEKLGLILEDTRSSELAYRFKHDLIHEVVYEHIDGMQRKSLHALVGSTIERSFADRLEEFFGLLAFHYSQAEDWEKAQEYLFKAGDQAGFIAADAEALDCYTQAQHAYAQAFGDRWSPLQRASLERKIGEAFYRRGDHDRAMDYLHRSLAYLNQSVPTSRFGTRLRLVRELGEQIWNRVRPSQAPTNDRAMIDVEEAVRTHMALTWIHSSSDLQRFLLHTLALVNQSERKGFTYGRGIGYAAVGVSCDFVSFFRLAADYHKRALEAAEHSRHPIPLSHAYMAAALHSSTLADWNKAVYLSGRAAEYFQRVGDLKGWAYVSHLKCCALSYRGDYSQVLATARAVYETMDYVGDPESMTRAKWNEGYVLIRLGRLQEATESLLEAEALAQSVNNPISRVTSCHELALLALLQHRLEDALARAQELEKMLSEYRTTQYLCVPSHNAVSQAYLQKAEESRSTERDYWIREARLACKRGLRQAKACHLVRPEAMRLNGTCKWIAGNKTAAVRWWKRGLAVAFDTGQRYDMVTILREMGNRLLDRECLERAHHICKELGTEL